MRRSFRIGFIVALITSASLAIGSSLWAITLFPFLPKSKTVAAPVPVPTAPDGPSMAESFHVKNEVPVELGWFFYQFPYISSEAKVISKSRHRFVVSDGPRKREYVITVSQRSRRVEVYFADAKEICQILIFTPGHRRLVQTRKGRIEQHLEESYDNLWMWQTPLWNDMHLKIYSMVEEWKDSPFKKYSCAGFVHQFLREAGVQVPRLDAWDMAKQPWSRISADELEPGDVITFRAGSARHRRMWNHNITHVGVYIGNGQFIHAATASPKSKRAIIKVAQLDTFRTRIDKILRPPELL